MSRHVRVISPGGRREQGLWQARVTLLGRLPTRLALVIVLVLACLPVSRMGSRSQEEWWDQKVFNRSVKEALAGGAPVFVEQGLVGAGYIALGVLFARIPGMSVERALVGLNRISFVAAVLFFFGISYLLARRGLSAVAAREPNRSAAWLAFSYTLLAILCMDLAAFSDIPWTHFVSLGLVMAFFMGVLTLREYSTKSEVGRLVGAASIGAVSALLLQVRVHEGAVVLAVVYGFLLSELLWQWHRRFKSEGNQATVRRAIRFAVVGVASFAGIFWLIMTLSHQDRVKWLYFSLAAKDPFTSLGLQLHYDTTWLKLVQIFVDPNLYTNIAPYSIQPLLFGFDWRTWQMPVFLQLPILLYAVPAAVAVLLLGGRIARRGWPDPLAFIAPALIAGGLIVGYVSNALAGSPHLRYGFVREFMIPAFLIALVAGPWNFIGILGGRVQKLGPGRLALLASSLPFLIGVVYGQGLVRKIGFPRFPRTHLARIEVLPECHGGQCAVQATMIGASGEAIELPIRKAVVSGHCPSTQESFARTLNSWDERFEVVPCDQPYNVWLFPLLMGQIGTPYSPGSPYNPIVWEVSGAVMVK